MDVGFIMILGCFWVIGSVCVLGELINLLMIICVICILYFEYFFVRVWVRVCIILWG